VASGWVEKWQHDKTLRPPTPLAERLPKIRVRCRNVPPGSHVEEPSDADGAIANKPVGFIARSTPLSLEQIVNQASRIREILAKVADASSDRLHHDEPINPARRFDHASHEPLVEFPHDPIQWLEGVGDGSGENECVRRRHVGRTNRQLLPAGWRRETER
jgi:hypothetical protein